MKTNYTVYEKYPPNKKLETDVDMIQSFDSYWFGLSQKLSDAGMDIKQRQAMKDLLRSVFISGYITARIRFTSSVTE